MSAHLSRSPSESTLMTPSDAAPELGFSTAGKPTTSAARGRSSGFVTARFLGVGSPAALITSLVRCSAEFALFSSTGGSFEWKVVA